MKNLTIVTGLFDIGRDKLDKGFCRTFQTYLDNFKKLLEVNVPMVIFTEEKVEPFIWKHRHKNNTKIIIKKLHEFPFLKQTNKIRKNKEWYSQATWLEISPQAKLELYNPLVMSKQFWLNDASILNYFDTDYFLWVDAGIANTVGNIREKINNNFIQKIKSKMNKMLYVCFPYETTTEIHGFKKSEIDAYASDEVKFVARGGVFGGHKRILADINDKYYQILSDTLNNGYMGTEESIFSIIAHKYPELCNCHMINENGLVYKFFDDINSQKQPTLDEDKLAIYCLTYNTPKQFETWIESFLNSYPETFLNNKKYVLDNTTDKKTKIEYNKIFKKYGFEVFNYNNIGICDGRQKIAEHFNNSKHEYMVFFEDDMLLHTNEAFCKNGFRTKFDKNIFDTLMVIVENENLDYLKLSFSEFFGDNHINWGITNMSKNNLKPFFPDGSINKKTKIDYTGSIDSVPYSVGEYHYCNWPIIFTKNGNKKIFIETKYAKNYEQNWMVDTFKKIRSGKIKAGCLLASMINHNRTYYYGNQRKENQFSG
jgi:hypothetical protein